MCGVEDLPDSLLLSMFCWLDLKDLCAVSTCCRTWARVGWDELLWKSLFLRHFDLPNSAAMPEDAVSWRLEFRRLYQDVPCIEAVKLTAHADEVLHVTFSQDGSLFASCSKDCSVKVWDGHSYELLHNEDLHNRSWLYSQFSQFSHDGLRLLVSGVKNSPFEMSSGSILIFSLDGFSLLTAADIEPYDVFGCWFGGEAFLSGNIEAFSIFRFSVNFALEKFFHMQRQLLHFRLVNYSYPRMLTIARAHTGEEDIMLEADNNDYDDDDGNKLLIFATGSLTYASHQIGIKLLRAEVLRTLIKLPRVAEGLVEHDTDGHENEEEANIEAVDDWLDARGFQGNIDGPTSLDWLLEFNGQIVGLCLSPDHRKHGSVPKLWNRTTCKIPWLSLHSGRIFHIWIVRLGRGLVKQSVVKFHPGLFKWTKLFSSSLTMDSPLMLISSDTKGKFVLNEETVKILSDITKPVVVVAIVGRYRTGKSYLMNLLAGHQTGFALGHTVQSHTKGIWVWALPHPYDKHKYLLLLDTEGLGDVEKGSSSNDMSLFTMALLLSSQLVFNTTSVLSKDGLDQLQLVVNLADHMKTKTTQSDDERGSDFDEYLPGLVVCVRDFTLQLEINGQSCDADGYLNHCLGLRKKGNTRECRSFNEQRELLEQYFLNRRCFVFPPPASPENMQCLESISEDQINQQFVKTAENFKKFVLLKTPVKNIQGTVMNGKRFMALASQYVEAQRKGVIPCIEDATTSISSAANKEALEQSTELYKQCMEAIRNSLPLTTKDLNAAHGRATERAVLLFKDNSVLDRERKYEEELNKTLMKEYETWLQVNCQTSTNRSEKRLAELYQPLKEQYESGAFECGGAYERYNEELDAISTAFRGTEGLGEQAIHVLMKFLIERNKDSNHILSMDKMMDMQQKLQQEQEARDRLAEEQKRAKEEQDKHNAEIIRTLEEQNKMVKEELNKKREELAELTQKRVNEDGAGSNKMKTLKEIVGTFSNMIPLIALAYKRA